MHRHKQSRRNKLPEEEFAKDFVSEKYSENTTNVYIGNLAPQVTEPFLYKEVGKFGPIANLKLVTTKDDSSRERGCCFLNFVERHHAEEAVRELEGHDFFGYPLFVAWGREKTKDEKVKSPLPKQRDVKIKMELPKKLPSSSSSAPPLNKQTIHPEITQKDVSVVVPSDEQVLEIIHLLAAYVAKDGMTFENAIKEKEMNNPQYQFLFQTSSPEYIYYQWRVYMLLQHDTELSWRTTPFQMYVGGPVWLPPKKEFVPRTKSEREKIELDQMPGNKKLPDSFRETLEEILENLTTERRSIKDAMGFALDNTEFSREIASMISDSLSKKETPVPLTIARLFLVSDILHNSSARVPNASSYRRWFEISLPKIFENLNNLYKNTSGRITAENMKEQILRVLRIWEGWSVYSPNFLRSLTNTFLESSKEQQSEETKAENIDGVPIDEDIDGVPMFETEI